MSETFTTVSFLYRCRRCGGIDRNPHVGATPNDDYAAFMALIGAINGYETSAGMLYLHSTHRCKDGGMGVSDLIGYEPDIRTTNDKKPLDTEQASA